MKLQTPLLMLFTLIAFSSVAQKNSLKWAGSVQVGLLEGDAGGEPQLGATAGVRKGTWTASVGTGLDYYHTRSVPLFGELRKDFSAGPKTLFAYMGSGYHFPWLRSQEKSLGQGDTDGGFYGDAGVGYQFPVFKSQQLFFSVGFSQKRMTQYEDNGVYIAIFPQPPRVYQRVGYVLNRISIKTGLRL